MKKVLKDITQFGIANVALGGFGLASSSLGTANGLSGVSKMMPALGSVVATKHIIRLTGDIIPKKKKK